MTDPESLIALGASAQLAVRVLGPTADYLGGELQQLAEKRFENVKRIFESADRRLGSGGDGTVPPRVLKEILDDGSFCDDDLTVEYFGGVLASSKSGVSRDDRAATMTRILSGMSTYEVRLHYILYALARSLMVGGERQLGLREERDECTLFVPRETWFPAMDYSEEELADQNAIGSHAINGLGRNGLIEEGFGRARPVVLGSLFPKVFPDRGIVFTPSLLGMELFVAAHGHKGSFVSDLFQAADVDFEVDVPIEMPHRDCVFVRNLPDAEQAEL